MNAEAFFAYAVKRESIRIRREAGNPPPWTDDPILQQFRFCNVFREDDLTTRWFRENLRDPLKENPEKVIFATVAFRWFNRIKAGCVFADDLLEGRWDAIDIKRRILDVMIDGPYVTGSFIVKTPNGMNKLDGVLWCINNVWRENARLSADLYQTVSQEAAWTRLTQFPYLGDFMAYEVTTDLRHTCVGGQWNDLHTWANPGPGACRGLARVQGRPVDSYNRSRETHRRQVIAGMQELLQLSRNPGVWPAHWCPWEMREVEHTLCEFDKYERARLGEGEPRQIFRSGA
jgi:hypothetical protein